MHKISELAGLFGLARSTLLYYDRIGILQPSARSRAGYRLYSDSDRKRLEQIRYYRQAGLELDEIRQLLSGKTINNKILQERLDSINREIQALQAHRRLLSGMLKTVEGGPGNLTRDFWLALQKSCGMDDAALKQWHIEFEMRDAAIHHNFLLSLGISEKEAILIRKLTHTMEDNTMNYYYELFEGLDMLGPSGPEHTRRALSLIPDLPQNPAVLDIGCGNGAQSRILAEELGRITAIDNHAPFLEQIKDPRIETRCASMNKLPFKPESFDLIWSEAAIYIIGFEEGLKQWRRYLKPGGYLAVSEVTWLVIDPPQEANNFWQREYPAITSPEANLETAIKSGYRIIDHFNLPAQTWRDYYDPIEQRLNDLEKKYAGIEEAQTVYAEVRHEIEIFNRFGDTYGYTFFILQKPSS